MWGRRIITTVFAAGALVAVPAAFGATPQQVYDDMADNGRLDGTYTAADIQAALGDATVQGYGSPTVIVKLQDAGPCEYMVNGQGYDAQGRPVPATGPNCVEGGVAGATECAYVEDGQGYDVNGNAVPATGPNCQEGGVAGAQEPPLSDTAQAGNLPFTGAELAVFAVIGLGLLASGLILRRTARSRS